MFLSAGFPSYVFATLHVTMSVLFSMRFSHGMFFSPFPYSHLQNSSRNSIFGSRIPWHARYVYVSARATRSIRISIDPSYVYVRSPSPMGLRSSSAFFVV